MQLSPPLPDALIPPIRTFAHQLRAAGLVDLLACYAPTSVSWLPTVLEADLPLIPQPLRDLARLVVLGHSFTAEAADALLGDGVPAALVAAGVANAAEGSFSLGALQLVHHLGVQVFAERPSTAIRLYHGDDSLGLGRRLVGARGRVLDLCAGVGTQGVLCALSADEVIGVELQPAAAPLQAVNAALNGVEGRIRFCTGDHVDAVAGERFDLVCCNPPLLPIPPRLPFPFVGDGGADGQRLILRMLAALPDLLHDGGRCLAVTTLLGSHAGPDLRALREASVAAGLRLDLLLSGRAPLLPGSRVFDDIVRTAVSYAGLPEPAVIDEARRFYRSPDRCALYFVHLMARRGPPEVSLIRHDTRSTGMWTF